MTTHRNPAEDPKEKEKDPLGALERYACTPNPETLSPAVHHAHNDATITVYDAYPKCQYHLLVLPRPREGVVTVHQLTNLPTLLGSNKALARRVLEEMGEAAEKAKQDTLEDMMKLWRFKWDVWIGFHAIPSMRHLHLHVLSADLDGKAMKTKKHYNTFHPKLGYFLRYEDVMEWFDATPSFYDMKVRSLRPSQYAPLLKADLECFKCDRHGVFDNMGLLKEHLDQEFDEMKERGREREARAKQIMAQLEKRRLKLKAEAEAKEKTNERKREREEGEGEMDGETQVAEGGGSSRSVKANLEESSAASVASAATSVTAADDDEDERGRSTTASDGMASPPAKRQATRRP